MAILLQVVGVITAALEQHAAQALPGQDCSLTVALQAVSSLSQGEQGDAAQQRDSVSAAAAEAAAEAHAIAVEVR